MIDKIEYTGNVLGNITPYNSIEFVSYTEERTDKNSSTVTTGVNIQSKTLLKQIKVKQGTSVVKSYQLKYIYANYASLLQEITEYTGDPATSTTSFNPTLFQYGETTTPTNATTLYDGQVALNNNATQSYYTGDFNGDGFSDVATFQSGSDTEMGCVVTPSFPNLYSVNKLSSFTVKLNSGTTSYATSVNNNTHYEQNFVTKATVPIPNNSVLSNYCLVEVPVLIPTGRRIYGLNTLATTHADFNGDGKDDILTLAALPKTRTVNSVYSYYQGEKVHDLTLYTNVAAASPSTTNINLYPNQPLSRNDVQRGEPLTSPDDKEGWAWDKRGLSVTSVGDFDGDGRSDILIVTRPYLRQRYPVGGIVPVNPFSYDFDWETTADINVKVALAANNFQPITMNSTATPVKYKKVGVEMAGTYNSFWGVNTYKWTDIETMSYLQVFVVDQDGDGKQEIVLVNPWHAELYKFDKPTNGTLNMTLVKDIGVDIGRTSEGLVYNAGDGNGLLPNYNFGDFNGDGKTDLLIGYDKIWYSDGTGYSTGTPFNFGNPNPSAPNATYPVKGRPVLADFNRDGKTDILLNVVDNLNYETLGIYYSTGSAFNYEFLSYSQTPPTNLWQAKYFPLLGINTANWGRYQDPTYRDSKQKLHRMGS